MGPMGPAPPLPPALLHARVPHLSIQLFAHFHIYVQAPLLALPDEKSRLHSPYGLHKQIQVAKGCSPEEEEEATKGDEGEQQVAEEGHIVALLVAL